MCMSGAESISKRHADRNKLFLKFDKYRLLFADFKINFIFLRHTHTHTHTQRYFENLYK